MVIQTDHLPEIPAKYTFCMVPVPKDEDVIKAFGLTWDWPTFSATRAGETKIELEGQAEPLPAWIFLIWLSWPAN